MSSKESVSEIAKLLNKEKANIMEEWNKLISNVPSVSEIDPKTLILESESLLVTFIKGLGADDLQESAAIANSLAQETAKKGIDFSHLIRIVLILRDAMSRAIVAKFSSDVEKLTSLLKAFEYAANTFLTSLVIGFVETRDEVIRSMLNPIFLIQDDILLLPLVGTLDSVRAEQLTEQLLESIHSYRAHVCILDIKGVPIVDTGVANHLLQTVQAARLMGANVLISSISSHVAMTLVSLGINMESITTCANLQTAIIEANALVRDRRHILKKE